MAYDGLHDIFTDQAMGNLTESKNQDRGHQISREEQDAFASASHQNAARAWKDGLFDDEVVPVLIPQRKEDPVVVAQDEGIRADTTVQTLARLRPAFTADGTLTAGSASQISDGAAAVVVDEPCQSRGFGADLGSADRGARGGGRSGIPRCSRSRPGRSRRRVRGRGSTRRIWIWWRSTRHSRRWGSHRRANSDLIHAR